MPKTQNQKIKEYLEGGHKITTLKALRMFGCLRLGARIADLKKLGMDIETEMIHDKVSGKCYASYSITRNVSVNPEPKSLPVIESQNSATMTFTDELF